MCTTIDLYTISDRKTNAYAPNKSYDVMFVSCAEKHRREKHSDVMEIRI